MGAIRFTTTIGPDGLIHLPEGIAPPLGAVEVLVTPQPDAEGTAVRPLWERLAGAARELGVEGLPSDLAAEHDHDARGAAKGLDRR